MSNAGLKAALGAAAAKSARRLAADARRDAEALGRRAAAGDYVALSARPFEIEEGRHGPGRAVAGRPSPGASVTQTLSSAREHL